MRHGISLAGQLRVCHTRSGTDSKQTRPTLAGASATNRCPKQRFACTDAMKPVLFKIERMKDDE